MQTFNSPAWVLWLVPLLALAVQIPPHARVNTLCHPVWNADRSNLDVVWKGKTYSQPWTFNVEVDERDETCMADECVQRLWCTDSGVVGRYVIDGQRNGSTAHLRLDFAWLEDLGNVAHVPLQAIERDGKQAILAAADAHGPGTLQVAGSWLVFFVRDPSDGDNPVLAALEFDDLADTPLEQRWRYLVHGVDAGSSTRESIEQWRGVAYRAGMHHIGIQVSMLAGGKQHIRGHIHIVGSRARGAVELYDPLSLPERRLWLVSVLCSPNMDDTIVCTSHRSDGVSPTAVTNILPPSAWLPGSMLASSGIGAALWEVDRKIVLVERLPDPSCPSGLRLAVVARDPWHNMSVTAVSEKLGCFAEQSFPKAAEEETPFEATAVKTAGLTEAGLTFHVALDIAKHEYAVLHAACNEGEHLVSETCTRCSAGHFCPGLPGLASDMRVCPPGSHSNSVGMARCAVAQGHYFQLPGEVLLCEPGFFCPGGLSEREQCPQDKPRSPPGAWSAAQCML